MIQSLHSPQHPPPGSVGCWCEKGNGVEKRACLNDDARAASTGSSSSDMAHCDDKVMSKYKVNKRRLSDSEQSWKHKVPEYSKSKQRKKTYGNN